MTNTSIMKLPLVHGACVALFAALLSSCEVVDDQRQLPQELQEIVNPRVTSFDPEAQRRHQVLVAVIDTGVDYNHPDLAKKIHYTLNAKGQPVGAGYDFVGEDPWPSPYLVWTGHLAASTGDSVKAKSLDSIAGVADFVSRYPEHGKLLTPQRALRQELDAGTYHGTHVAGLTAYDNDRIGILPYRVLPMQQAWIQSSESFGAGGNLLVLAIERAVQDGARVVNFSLGDFKTAGDDSRGTFKKTIEQVEEVVRRFPQVVFVAAAGNEGIWIDGKRRMGYPCGIQASNMLCVGSLAPNEQDLSEFTNVPLVSSPVVFALGEDVISTVPTRMCGPAVKPMSNVTNLYSNLERVGSERRAGNRVDSQLIARTEQDFRKYCGSREIRYAPLSGTSMATPLVARVVAEKLLSNPSLTGVQALDSVLQDAQGDALGDLKTRKLRIRKPSWYQGYSASRAAARTGANGVMLVSEKLSDRYFELVVR